MSAITDDSSPPTLAKSKRLGRLFGANKKPVTTAPISASHRESQAPLKPVWPVIKTRLSRQNSAVTTKLSRVLSHQSKVLLDRSCRAKYPSAAKNHYVYMREAVPRGIGAPAARAPISSDRPRYSLQPWRTGQK